MASIELQILANITNLQRNLQRGGQGVDKFADQSEKKVSKAGARINAALGGVAVGIAAAFSVSAVTAFANNVIKATAEVQKLGAVLSNALGSKTIAESSMRQLQEFAAVTPFGVNELTSAFVKLVNQGFTPTMDQIRQLGDLASSTGKSFDQLTEAIIDAQVGEYERLKEFGVRAKDAGDTIIFTFKGVQTQVDKTSSSIREYITGLGNAEGVSGSMAAISATLGGQISNLQDSYDQMLISIGNNTSGAFSTAIAWLDKMIARVKDLNEEVEISSKYGLAGDFWQKLNRALNPFSRGMTDRERSVVGIQATSDWVDEYVRGVNGAAKSTEDFDKAVQSLLVAIDNARKEDRPFGEIEGIVDQYSKGIQSLIDLQQKFTENAKKQGDANFGKKAGEDIENQYSALLKTLRKLQNETVLATLDGYQKELKASKFKYEELKRQADEYYKDGKIRASEYSQYLIELAKAEQRERFRIVTSSGIGNAWDQRQKQLASNWRPWTGAAQPQGLNTTGVVPTQLPNQVAKVVASDPVWDAFVDDLDKQLGRAVHSFGRDFMRTLTTINQQAGVTFGGVVSGIIGSLTGGITEVMSTVFSKQLGDAVKGAFGSGGLGKTGTYGAAGVAMLGSIVSGSTSRTSVGGQALGGALTGAGTGAALGSIVPGLGTAVGAVLGAVVGALGGLFGASSARKREKQQEAMLAEQRKQTALLERQNALTYASSIIGQMTSGGIVSGLMRDAFGQLVATVKGSDLQFVLQRAEGSR